METNKKKKKTKKPRIPEGEDPEERSPPTPARRGGAPLGALVSGAGAERRAAVGAASAHSCGGGGEEEEEEGESRQQSVRHCLARVGFGIAATPAGDARRPPHGGWTGGGGAAPDRLGGRRASRSQTWPRGTYEREASRTRTCASTYMCVSTVQARPLGRGRRQPPGRGLCGEAAPPPARLGPLGAAPS